MNYRNPPSLDRSHILRVRVEDEDAVRIAVLLDDHVEGVHAWDTVILCPKLP